MEPRIVFCGDRQIACDVLDAMQSDLGIEPIGLILSDSHGATHQHQIEARCPTIPGTNAFRSSHLGAPETLDGLRSLNPDLLVSVHFPHFINASVLAVPSRGAVNLHPSFLPFNRGWHTPTWSILDGTPAGATLHYMTEQLDGGPILAQRQVPTEVDDTADTLYQRILDVEVAVFLEGLPRALAGEPGVAQGPEGTQHLQADLSRMSVGDLEAQFGPQIHDIVRVMRALTTSQESEASWIRHGDSRYAIRIAISQIPD